MRAYGTDKVEDGAEPGPYVQIGTLGSIPSTQLASKAQVRLGGGRAAVHGERRGFRRRERGGGAGGEKGRV